jgi:SAM-dependent methyltransferase
VFKAEIVKKIRPLRNRKLDTREICTVCGIETRMIFNSWAIDKELLIGWNDEEAARDYLYRESMFCSNCNSSYRVRRLAYEIVNEFNPSAISLKNLLSTESFQRLSVLEINEIGSFGSMHKFLKTLPNCITTLYIEDGAFGKMLDGKSIQNLENLTFEDNVFDLVIHSDTLEHVPQLDRAVDEIYRVLKPRGISLFTVPLRNSVENSFSRVNMTSSGDFVYVHPKLYHGRGGGPYSIAPLKQDYLEFTSFGADAQEVFERETCIVDVHLDRNANFNTGADAVFKVYKTVA